jgi:hypothetical protein
MFDLRLDESTSYNSQLPSDGNGSLKRLATARSIYLL